MSMLKTLHQYNFSKYPIQSVKNRVNTDWAERYKPPRQNGKINISDEFYDALDSGNFDGDFYNTLAENEKKIADEIYGGMRIPLIWATAIPKWLTMILS